MWEQIASLMESEGLRSREGNVRYSPIRRRSGSEFPFFHHTHVLVSCVDFIMSAGTLCPMALCGRCSL